MTKPQVIAGRVRQLRKDGLNLRSCRALGDLLGVSAQAVSGWETGSSGMGSTSLILLSVRAEDFGFKRSEVIAFLTGQRDELPFRGPFWGE